MMALTFVIEFTVVRHYAFATIFITPLTILLGEAATLGHGSASALIQARFFDTALGCFVGLVGEPAAEPVRVQVAQRSALPDIEVVG